MRYEQSNNKSLITERRTVFGRLQSERSNWNNIWQLVAQYVWTIKANFTTETSPGVFLNSHLFDVSATKAMRTRASILVTYLWNQGSFKLIDVDKDLAQTTAITYYWEEATDKLVRILNNSNLVVALDECERNAASFGTYCLLITVDKKGKLQFNCLDLRDIYIDDNAAGLVDTLYYHYELTAAQAVKEFGFDNCCKKVQQDYQKGENSSKIKILRVIQPRDKLLNKAPLPDHFNFESVYIDLSNEHVMAIEGFYEQPFFVGRENRRTSEKYGRGCGIEAISDILQVNVNQENYTVITNKMAKPSKGVFMDALPGNGIINLSPDSINVFNASTTISGKPIFNLEDSIGGDLKVVMETTAILDDKIMQAFDLDRLLDLNNETEMTATETVERKQIRQQSLGSMLKIKMNEFYKPIVERCFNILFRNGELGYFSNDPEYIARKEAGGKPLLIPDEIQNRMLDGEEIYDIKWLTPFAQEEEFLRVMSYMQVWQNAGAIAALTQDPAIFDNLDVDKTVSMLIETAASNKILRSAEEVKIMRDQKQKLLATQQALSAGQQVSDIQKNLNTNSK